LAEVIGDADCALAGGLAVTAHGFVRATRDVDLVTRRRLSEARERLAREGIEVRLRRGNPLEGDFRCLKGTLGGIPFDVLPELVPVNWSATVPLIRGRGATLHLIGLEDLLRLKFKAQGPKDLMDAAMLILLHPDVRERARALAASFGTGDRLDHWLEDRRLIASAREEASRDRESRRRPGKDAEARKKGRRPSTPGRR
jgi:hypothetical protein